MSRRLRLCVWLVALLPLSGLAGEDFSKGLEQFERLALPDVSKAEYVRLVGGWKLRLDAMMPHGPETNGNAWLLREVRDKDGRLVKGEFVVNGCQRIEIAVGDGRSWVKTKLDVDVERVSTFFKMSDEATHGKSGYPGDDWSAVLLFALQLRQRGMVADSERMLSGVFARSSAKLPVVQRALCRLADAQSDELYQRFRGDRDWKLYCDGLKGLTAKFPDAWTIQAGGRLLLRKLEWKERNPDVLPASLLKSLDSSERELALGLLRARRVRASGGFFMPPCPWMLPVVWEAQCVAEDADLKIRALGVEALPFLLKLVEDGTLTELDWGEVRSGDVAGSKRLVGLGRRGSDEILSDGINRPATLGEVAVRIIQEMLPQGYLAGDAKTLGETARSFYARFHGAGAEELAVVCLDGGCSGASPELLAYLLQLGRQRRLPRLERYLLSTVGDDGSDNGKRASFEELVDRFDFFVHYAAAVSGEGMEPLVARMTAALTAKAGRVGDIPGYEYMPKLLRHCAEELPEAPFGATLEDLLSDYLTRRCLPSLSEETLHGKLLSMDQCRVLGLLLRRAAAVEYPWARVRIARLLDDLYGQGTLGKDVGPPSFAKLWLPLLDDHRPVAAGRLCEGQVSDYFLALNERLYAMRNLEPALALSPMDVTGASYGGSLLFVDRDATRMVLRKRALARLAGTVEKDLPPWPDGHGPFARYVVSQ